MLTLSICNSQHTKMSHITDRMVHYIERQCLEALLTNYSCDLWRRRYFRTSESGTTHPMAVDGAVGENFYTGARLVEVITFRVGPPHRNK